jgi:putative Ca2+/H+ antiporter (TMEM165/GDT1 family)
LTALLVSIGVVALAEIADKTQLLALVLAAKFRKPWPIILGIFVATLANHAAAGALGAWLMHTLDPQWLRWLLGASFLAVALWMLVPDRAGNLERHVPGRLGIFGLTTVAFFIVEIGDKTQIATVMLAARFDSLATVVVGTTLGMLLANVPVVLLGDKAMQYVPALWVHRIAAIVFAVLGLLVLAGAGV